MSVLKGKKPETVFSYFEEICGIPHGSGNEQMISDYLVAFAKKLGLRYRQDEERNVVIWKKGSPGYEDSQPVILQGHMDMVAVKDPDVDKDLEKEGLDLLVEGDMLMARGTSLGGDDGIAVAYMLAVLSDDTLVHPPIEAVFTTGEEVSMIGANFLDVSDLKGRKLLNIDSEDEGIFTVSCAGGATVRCMLPLMTEQVRGREISLRIDGFKGGHSGSDIHKGTLNAVFALGRILYQLQAETGIQIVGLEGGDKDNAIPIWAEAILMVPDHAGKSTGEKDVPVQAGGSTGAEDVPDQAGGSTGAEDAPDAANHMSTATVIRCARDVFETMKQEYQGVEPDMTLSMEVTENQAGPVFTKDTGRKVVAALMNLPNGIQRMNPVITDMVQTSLNLGVMRTLKGKEPQSGPDVLMLTFSVRSSVESEKHFLIDRLRSLTDLLGGSIELACDYPGWEYEPDSEIRDVLTRAYVSLYGKEPVIEGIHAGLECGLFAEKLPGLDAISFGPQMYDIHTTREQLGISSTERTWELLCKALEMLAG